MNFRRVRALFAQLHMACEAAWGSPVRNCSPPKVLDANIHIQSWRWRSDGACGADVAPASATLLRHSFACRGAYTRRTIGVLRSIIRMWDIPMGL